MINTVGPYLTCRAFVGAMIDGGWGRIVNVTSAAALHEPGPVNSAYGTSKAALNQFTRHLASELKGTGVTANVIHPGDVKTDMWAEIKASSDRLGNAASAYLKWANWVGANRRRRPGKGSRPGGRIDERRSRRDQWPILMDQRWTAGSNPKLGRTWRTPAVDQELEHA